MPNAPVPAAGEAMPNPALFPADPVLDIAIALRGAVDRYDRADAHESALRRSGQSVSEDVAGSAYDLELSLREMLSHHKAASLLGATAQMGVMLSKLEDVRDDLAEAGETFNSKQSMRAIIRLACSVFGVLRTTVGSDLEKITYSGFYSPVVDPWAALAILDGTAEPNPSPVQAAAADFLRAEKAYRPHEMLDNSDPLYQQLFRATEAAEEVLLRSPCLGIDDVRAKVQIALDHESVFDSLANCTYGDEESCLKAFLRSLIGEDA